MMLTCPREISGHGLCDNSVPFAHGSDYRHGFARRRVTPRPDTFPRRNFFRSGPITTMKDLPPACDTRSATGDVVSQ
jgi:hypothetical protein